MFALFRSTRALTPAVISSLVAGGCFLLGSERERATVLEGQTKEENAISKRKAIAKLTPFRVWECPRGANKANLKAPWEVDIENILESFDSADVCLVGEVHDDPVAHAVEYALFRAAIRRYKGAKAETNRSVLLSLEMFDRDVQPVVDEYIAGCIPEADFLKDSRPWPTFETDYRPLVNLAQDHAVPVIAANAPRRYVSIAGRKGAGALDDLRGVSSEAAKWLPPQHLLGASPEYREKFIAFMGQPPLEENNGCPYIGLSLTDNMLAAQCMWDASMATSIHDKLSVTPDAFILHINGKFHSEQSLGIPEKLLELNEEVKIKIVTVVPTPSSVDIDSLTELPKELWGFGDFVVLSNSEIPRSFKSQHPV